MIVAINSREGDHGIKPKTKLCKTVLTAFLATFDGLR